jgi:hypothetical protein
MSDPNDFRFAGDAGVNRDRGFFSVFAAANVYTHRRKRPVTWSRFCARKHKAVALYEVSVVAEQRPALPQVFTHVRIHHSVTGDGVDLQSVEDAIKLSEHKYCSVGEMFPPERGSGFDHLQHPSHRAAASNDLAADERVAVA